MKDDVAAGDANPGEADAVEEQAPAAETPVEPAEEAPKEEESTEDSGYQFDDDLTSSEPAAPAPSTGGGGGGGRFADEIYSKTIQAKFRTFYVDLKESSNGKFLKISEKSRGRKSTIMMDAEDIPEMIAALEEVKAKL